MSLSVLTCRYCAFNDLKSFGRSPAREGVINLSSQIQNKRTFLLRTTNGNSPFSVTDRRHTIPVTSKAHLSVDVLLYEGNALTDFKPFK
ncbi:hypothetical protein XENORESO_020321 [Xenotaenia resolanae]|uniref:Uncharacterized protein n=1 Tax=Xenotaenia resolanae TaxID=208358 RepID=A0ABV0XA76_9TELE